ALPELELDISLDNDSLLDYSDEHSSIAEVMQTSRDVRMRVDTPPTSSRILGQQTPRGCAESSGLPLPPPPSVRSSLLDQECFAGPAAPSAQLHPLFRGGARGTAGDMGDTLLGPSPGAGVRAVHAAPHGQGEGLPLLSSGGGCNSGLPLARIPTMRLGQK